MRILYTLLPYVFWKHLNLCNEIFILLPPDDGWDWNAAETCSGLESKVYTIKKRCAKTVLFICIVYNLITHTGKWKVKTYTSWVEQKYSCISTNSLHSILLFDSLETENKSARYIRTQSQTHEDLYKL